ncbi:MAG: peptidyl-prolyl cis-trans isomerase [Prosthecobacter sp.]|uniref:peptidylprolyl isomerase n=1 Tax=Prosthecobacter sp. TaxID=1965333 RepID=UPI0025E462E0|nr:peptidyl-prolyl cis-trans isomerase [Prosthecobacter sp.]MCF7788378.1 peptidyl-prolyl cis-trans isomerase [Prosthecobacter sp.]
MSLTTPKDHGLPKVPFWNGVRCAVSVTAAWLLMTVAGGGLACALNAGAAKESPKDRVVAKVNGMPIFASDLDAMIHAQERVIRFQFANDPARLRKELAEVKRNALNGLIDFQLLEDEFFRLGGVIRKEDIDEDVKLAIQEAFKGDRAALMAELNAIGMTYGKYRELREQMIMVSAVRARIANKVEVTDKMVREHYENNLQKWRGPESVKFHTLTIFNTSANARSLAEGLRMKLASGGDFAEIARENSKDSRADDGGAWPWTSIANINNNVGKVMEKMKKGELSEVLEEPNSFVILRVDDIRKTEPKPFESVKEEVKKSLMEELSREKIENRLCRLREAAEIQKMGPV